MGKWLNAVGIFAPLYCLYNFLSYLRIPFAGGLSSYILPAAAVGAMGYCYMWWKVRCKIYALD